MPTSTIAFPTPTTASIVRITPCAWDGADDGQRQPPQRDTDAEHGGEATAIGEQRHRERADHRAGTDGRREHADARLADAEDLDRDDDHEHAEAPSGDRLGQRQPHEQEDVGMARQRAEAVDRLAEHVACRTRTGGGRRVVRQPGQRESGGERQQRRGSASAVAGSATASSTAARAGPISVLSESTRPRTTLALVSSNGVRHSDGSSAEWAGRKTTKAIVATAAKHVGERRRPVERRPSPRRPRAQRRGAAHVQRSTRSRRKRSASAVPTGDRTAAGTMRRNATYADRRRPAVAERDDGEGHGERPLARPCRRERQLRPPEVRGSRR